MTFYSANFLIFPTPKFYHVRYVMIDLGSQLGLELYYTTPCNLGYYDMSSLGGGHTNKYTVHAHVSWTKKPSVLACGWLTSGVH